MRALLTALFLLAAPAAALAECAGQNLLALMSPTERATLERRAAAVPYAAGNAWVARRDGQTVTLIGTYHLGDPRHETLLAAAAPLLDDATTLLVEAGPQEEAALVAQIAKTPALMVLADTTLPALLGPDDWAHLAAALGRRGMPGFMAAKFQPWYVSMLLATPPCALNGPALPDGLDALLIDRARAAGVPIRALEPFDTVFRIFDSLPLSSQIDMIRYSLAMEDRAEDFSSTIADLYFAGQPRMIWELTRDESLRTPGADPARVESDLALMEKAMMTTRNLAWIPVIEQAAAQGPTVAAFGALHLSGNEGVANLLAERGWTVTPLPIPLTAP